MRPPPPLLLAAACFLALPSPGRGDQLLVIGDSLSKEYETEFVGLYPDNPNAWQARNWCEILHQERTTRFDLGDWSVYGDFRATGHKYNCAKPGGTARDYRNFLRYQNADAESELRSTTAGNLAWPLIPTWRDTFDGLLGSGAERVVIFLGGNDLGLGNSDPLANPVVNGQPRQIEYGTIYAGGASALASPQPLMDSIRKNVKSVVDYVRQTKFPGLPIVLVAVPHLGCTPKVQAEYPTDPVATGRVTAALDVLNAELKDYAAASGMGWADVYQMTTDIISTKPFTIGGVVFAKRADADCRPRYLFSGDGFHPNTPAQARMAQIILEAFRTTFPATAIAPLGDREILTDVLGLDPDLPLKEWATANSLPSGDRGWADDPDGDGVRNLVEFALGLDPRKSDRALLPAPVYSAAAGTVSITWRPGPANFGYALIVPQSSVDLRSWVDLPAGAISENPDGSFTASPPAAPERYYLRLRATVVN